MAVDIQRSSPSTSAVQGFEMIEVSTALNTDKMAVNRRLQRQLIIRNYGPKIVANQGHGDNRGEPCVEGCRG